MDSIFEKLVEKEITYDEFLQYASNVNENNVYHTLGLSISELEILTRLGNEALDDILAARQHKAEIIKNWKDFFRSEIAENHRKNTLKLKNINNFCLNPFLDNYKANFLFGDSSPQSKASALVYARALGPSINTTFGTSLQKFCSKILSGYASTTSGIDIEYIDLIDGRRKYCQIKAGPYTINKDDVQTISNHFNAVRNLARTNNLDINLNDLVVGVFYGEPNELSTHYRNINDNYPVLVGKEFWYRLTGDSNFYKELTDAIDEVAAEYDGRDLLEEVISALADEIEKAED